MCMWILTIVYSKDIYNDHIEYFLFINLGMEGNGLVKLDVHHGPKVKPKNTEEPTIPIKKYGLRQRKMNQNMLQEELMS